ncbi:hypothetical protein J3R80_13620 [Aliiroseovarius sp. Z3]|uniref:hypothetical protein n=1 Tax=Aliiroseovarius sp. Z3 TaxID=2811402 RepID=UPI0023B285C9|nr:hypothetical protein [Aliiroseovarius sp. Z3]MDE9451507.1 hypothetical protein [Aliiroseovarius sp. Z3]
MESKVLSSSEIEERRRDFGMESAVGLVLVARSPVKDKLRYDTSKTNAYLTEYCGVKDNDCPDSAFDLDCTHFVCHALNKTGVFVQLPSTSCDSGLCIRVNDLAESFLASTKRYSNVSVVDSHSKTRSGDFCFIPGWFGLSKNHVMVLSDTASSTGAKVYGHTNERCGEFAEFEGEDCIYYRIEDT